MMHREFTAREKALILVLAILVLGLLYYLGAYRISKEGFEQRSERIAALQEEIMLETAKFNKIKTTRERLELIKSGVGRDITRIPDFDNIQPLMWTLDNIAAVSDRYSMSFGGLAFEDGMVRRPVKITFEVGSYDTAVSIIKSLAGCEYRSLIKSIDVSAREKNLESGAIALSLDVVFFELN